MSNLQMWALIVGFFSPIVIAIVQQPGWTNTRRSIVTFIYSAVAGGVTAYFNGQFHQQSIVSCVLTVLVVAIATYHGLWKQTGVAMTVENVTSRQQAPKHAA